MQHAGVQYGPGAAPSLHSTHYIPPENSPSVPNGNTTTSVLRSWRKKDAATEKHPPAEPLPAENQGPVARVAPHAHYPKQPVNDVYRYGQSFGEYSLPQTPQAPVPVKYSEIIEPMQGGIDHISPLVMAKPKEKYLDVCHIQQPHAINTTNYKPYSESMKNYASMQQYKEQYHPYMQKESQIPSNYVQKESNFSPYLPNFKMQNQYPRSYRESNDFLTNLNKIAPQMAQDIINDPHLRDSSQFPVYHSLEQNRLYQQQQRIYQPIHPTPSYGQRSLPPQNYNQYGMNQQRIPTDTYRLQQYQNNLARYSHEQMPPPPNTISPRHQYSEMNFPPLPHRISPSYPPCNQLEYSQHYQHRQAPSVRQEYIPVSDKTTYLDNPPEIPEIVPEESVQQPTKSLKRFLETWSEDHIVEESETQASQQDKVQTIKTPTPGRPGENTLYVFDAMEISSENIPQYLHLQPIDKLPPNIRGFYNTTEPKTSDASKSCVVAVEKTNESENAKKNEETNGEEVIESVIKSLPDLSYHSETVVENPPTIIEQDKFGEESGKNEESCEKNIQCDRFKAKSEEEQERTKKAEAKNANSEAEEEEDDEDQSSVYSDYSDDEVSDRNERSRSPIAPIIISCGESVIIKRKVKTEIKTEEGNISGERALNLSKRHSSESEADNNNEKQFADKHDETENEESLKMENRGVIIERRKYDVEMNNCDTCIGQNQFENNKGSEETQDDVRSDVNEGKQTASPEPVQISNSTSLEKEANEEEHLSNEENHVKHDESSPRIGDKTNADNVEKEDSMDEESLEEPTISSKTEEESNVDNSDEDVNTTNETETISNDTEVEGEEEEKRSPIIEDFIEKHKIVCENALLSSDISKGNETIEDEPCHEIQALDEELSSEMSVSENCFVLEVARELLQFTISEENGEKTISITPLTAVKIVLNEKQLEDYEENQEVSSSDPTFESTVKVKKEDQTKDIPINDKLDVEEGEIIEITKEEICTEIVEKIKEDVMKETKEQVVVETKEDISMEVTEDEDLNDIIEERNTELIEENEEILEEIIEEEEVIEEEVEEENDITMEEGESALVLGETLKKNDETLINEALPPKIEETEIIYEVMLNEEIVELTGGKENLGRTRTISKTKEKRRSVVSSEGKEEHEAIDKTIEEIPMDGELRDINKIEDKTNEEKSEKIKYRIEEIACVQVIPFECEVCKDFKDEEVLMTTADMQQDSINEYTITSQLFEETKITITNQGPDLSVKATITETIEDFDGIGKCEVLIPNIKINEEIFKTVVVLEDDEMPKLVPFEVDGNTSNIEYELPDSLGNPEVILDNHVSETVEVSSLEVSSTTNETSESQSRNPEPKFKRIKSPSVTTSRHYRKKTKTKKEAKERLKKQVNHVQLKCTVKLEEIKILKQTPKSALNLGRKDVRKKKKVSFRLDKDDKLISEGETKKRLPSPDLISLKDVGVEKVESQNIVIVEKPEDNPKNLKIDVKEVLPGTPNPERPVKTKENPSYSNSNIARSLWKNAVKNEKLFAFGKSPAEEINSSNKRRLSLEEYIKRKKYIRDIAQKTARSNTQTSDNLPNLNQEISLPTEIVLPKKSFHLDKSAIEEKVNSLELFLPKVNKLPQQRTTAQEEVSKKLEELLAQKPISFESRASESVLIRRFLNRECLKPEEVKKIRQIVQYKRALEELKSRRPDCRRRYSYDFSKNVNIDFRDFEIKPTQNPKLNTPARLNIEETNRELHESILSLSETNEVSSSQPNPEASKPKITEENVRNEELGKDLVEPIKTSDNETRNNTKSKSVESQSKPFDPGNKPKKPINLTNLAEPNKTSDNETRNNIQSKSVESQPKPFDPGNKLKKPINLESVQLKSPVPVVKEAAKLDLSSKLKPKPDESKHIGDEMKLLTKDLLKFTSDKSQVSNTTKPGSSETQKSSKLEGKIQMKPRKEVQLKSDSINDLQVDKTAPTTPYPTNAKRNCLISPHDLKTRLNALLNLYKKQVQASNENNTTIDMENLRKIEEIIQKLASSNQNVYEIRRPELVVPNKNLKIHLKKVPGDGQQKRRKRFRNLYSGEESEDESPTAKEAKMSVETSLTNGSAIDYSVYQRNTQAGVPKLVIKRKKSELKVDLQPFVKLIRMPSLDSLAKKRRKTIKLLLR